MDLFILTRTLTNSLLCDAPISMTPTLRMIQVDDVDLIVEMHQRLSAVSIYQRYHSPRLPTRQEIAQVCHLSQEKGCAIVAVIHDLKPKIIGMAHFIVTGQDSAEVALLVEDRYQEQGIGRRLMQQLGDLALAQGIRFFDAYVQPSNNRIIRLLHHSGQVIGSSLGYGVREMRVQLAKPRRKPS